VMVSVKSRLIRALGVLLVLSLPATNRRQEAGARPATASSDQGLLARVALFSPAKGGVRSCLLPKGARKTNLHCVIRWVHINKVPLHGFRYRMGVEIKDPPSEFRAFLKTLK
jgi:hypothetical protein